MSGLRPYLAFLRGSVLVSLAYHELSGMLARLSVRRKRSAQRRRGGRSRCGTVAAGRHGEER